MLYHLPFASVNGSRLKPTAKNKAFINAVNVYKAQALAVHFSERKKGFSL